MVSGLPVGKKVPEQGCRFLRRLHHRRVADIIEEKRRRAYAQAELLVA